MTGSDDPAVLRIEQLGYGHRGRELGRIDELVIRRGEIVAVLGPNGCGKTTLMRTLLGLLPAVTGRACVDGLALQGAGTGPDRRRIARHLAYVPQAHAGVFAYTALDVVLMGRAAHVGAFSMPSRADRAIASEALQRMGVSRLAHRPYTEISGGERQLVLIARALAQQASVLVMDEPTSSLDFGNQRVVLREIEALKRKGVAVLMSTHQPEHALRIADRVALMGRDGLQAVGPTAGTVTAEALARLYAVPVDEVARSVPGLGRPPALGR